MSHDKNLACQQHVQRERRAVAHAAANELASIIMGIQMLDSADWEPSDPQRRAFEYIQSSGDRLEHLIHEMNSWFCADHRTRSSGAVGSNPPKNEL